MIEPIQKSNHIITNHVVNRQSNNTTFGLHGNGFFNDGLTTIRRNRTRKVPYNQIEGGLAHCTIFDKNNNRLISDESVMNEGIYQLIRFGEHVFLEPVTTSITIQPIPITIPQASLPITPQPTFTRSKSTRPSTHRPVMTSSVPIPTQPVRNPSFPTSTTEQFEPIVQRTYSPDNIPTFQSDPTMLRSKYRLYGNNLPARYQTRGYKKIYSLFC